MNRIGKKQILQAEMWCGTMATVCGFSYFEQSKIKAVGPVIADSLVLIKNPINCQ